MHETISLINMQLQFRHTLQLILYVARYIVHTYELIARLLYPTVS